MQIEAGRKGVPKENVNNGQVPSTTRTRCCIAKEARVRSFNLAIWAAFSGG